MARFRFRRNVNIKRVISKIVVVVISLWIGGEILNAVGETMNGTTSPFYSGLTLIGWTVTSNTIMAYDGTGILTVVGLVGISSVILEFLAVEF